LVHEISLAGSERARYGAARAAALLLAGVCAAMMVTSCREELPSESPEDAGAEQPVGPDLDAIAAALTDFIQAHQGEVGFVADQGSLKGPRVRLGDGNWRLGGWVLIGTLQQCEAQHEEGWVVTRVFLKKEGEIYEIVDFDVMELEVEPLYEP